MLMAGVTSHPRAQPNGNHKRLKGALRGLGVEHEGSVEFDRALVESHPCRVLDGVVIPEYQVAF